MTVDGFLRTWFDSAGLRPAVFVCGSKSERWSHTRERLHECISAFYLNSMAHRALILKFQFCLELTCELPSQPLPLNELRFFLQLMTASLKCPRTCCPHTMEIDGCASSAFTQERISCKTFGLSSILKFSLQCCDPASEVLQVTLHRFDSFSSERFGVTKARHHVVHNQSLRS